MNKIFLLFIFLVSGIGAHAQNQIEKDADIKDRYLKAFGVDDSSRALIKYYVDAHSEYQKASKNLAIATPIMLGGAGLMQKNHNKNTFNQIVFWYLAVSGIIYAGGFVISAIRSSKYNENHLQKALMQYQQHQFNFDPLFEKKESFKKYLENEQ